MNSQKIQEAPKNSVPLPCLGCKAVCLHCGQNACTEKKSI